MRNLWPDTCPGNLSFPDDVLNHAGWCFLIVAVLSFLILPYAKNSLGILKTSSALENNSRFDWVTGVYVKPLEHQLLTG